MVVCDLVMKFQNEMFMPVENNRISKINIKYFLIVHYWSLEAESSL